ncbi:PP2C family protein-serine/threonine phosphatase [Aeromicrobium sp.]|uniref:PP2C family protein-serine/threonine phosphatase n=1 Tax=Aeromicrobium sp. TaxID=1871063 RepID=UPI003C6834D4
MPSLSLRYVALTDTGLRRSSNQDSGYASSRLIAIADGMGGAAAGDLASAETMNIVRQLDRDLDDVDPLTALGEAVRTANRHLGELVSADPAVEGMGTTLEAMLWDGQRFATAHIGDSRAYLLRDGTLTQLSTDHTFVQSLVDEGKLTPDEARGHPHRSLLLRVLLGRDDNEPDLDHLEGQLGDRYLLCSDGLTDMVDDADIARALGAETIDMAATELVRLALEGGGFDNVTVVIGELVDSSEEPDSHLSSSDGQPQLVGAAAGGPRPRTGHSAGHDGAGQGDGPVAVDPEELRYAPRPPGRWRWIRRATAVGAVVVILAVGAIVGYRWTQDQYFVAAHQGHVTVYRGVMADIPGISLQHVEEITDISMNSLPEFRRQQVDAGIEASSRADAERIVTELNDSVPEPTPSPSPSDDKKDEKAKA